MRLPWDPSVPVAPQSRPTRDLLLAQALDACITAERRLPGSAREIIARQPAWARADLQRLLDLAGSLDASASKAIMSSEFRVGARARLMQRIGGDSSPHRYTSPGRGISVGRASSLLRDQSQSPHTLVPTSTARMNVLPSGNPAQLASRKTFWVRLRALLQAAGLGRR